MELIFGLISFGLIVFIFSKLAPLMLPKPLKRSDFQTKLYFYSPKESIMTNAEWRFFERLSKVAAGRYHVFPQVHLSSLMQNDTKGKYYKLAFQRINRRSVDYVLCDIETHQPVYAVELDDWSHDSPKRQARDDMVQEMLDEIDLPLVRFRDVDRMSDEDLANRFEEVFSHQSDNGLLDS